MLASFNSETSDYDKVPNVHLKGVFFATQAMTQHLLNNEQCCKIVNISSVHEELPFSNFTVYCAGKGGVKMLTRNLAVELGQHGININNITPGAIETPIIMKLLNDPQKLGAQFTKIPLGHLRHPRNVASLAVFLVSNKADYVTGSTFYIDGGFTWNYQEQ